MNVRIFKNPYVLFFPFLILYIIIIIESNKGVVSFVGDEARYYRFAGNLLKGFYSPPAPKIDLTNGPGYPIILTPFVALGLPMITMKLINAFFYYLSIIFLFKSLQQIVTFRLTLIFSLIWAFYYHAYIEVALLFNRITYMVAYVFYNLTDC